MTFFNLFFIIIFLLVFAGYVRVNRQTSGHTVVDQTTIVTNLEVLCSLPFGLFFVLVEGGGNGKKLKNESEGKIERSKEREREK